jgi:hypothetical protein
MESHRIGITCEVTERTKQTEDVMSKVHGGVLEPTPLQVSGYTSQPYRSSW